jgi:threonine aldolase
VTQRGFASDNYAGVHPDVLAAIAEANVGHEPAYGADAWSSRAVQSFRELFGAPVEVFFAFNGTGANVTGMQTMLRPWQGTICASTAHINVDECGAPERFLSGKLIDTATPDGKLTPELVERVYFGKGVEHHVQPRLVSITQSTELGTLYRPEEVKALADTAHRLEMFLHMDGARLSNAAASLGGDVRSFTAAAGVDVLTFGGTKNGMLGGEAVVFLRPELAADYVFIRKQAMQLASKMRFVAAQFLAMLDDGLWLHNARHSNAMAQRLYEGVCDIPGVGVSQPVQANAVFATLPGSAVSPLQEHFAFYEWDAASHEVRWMCSWDTTEDDVDEFVTLVRDIVPLHVT